MYALLGNPKPIEAVLDRQTGEQKWRRLPGQAVTSFYFPDGTSVEEAILVVVDAMPHHMEPGVVPAWVETDDKALTRRLCVQYDIALTKNKRPPTWGQEEALDDKN